MHAVNKNKHRCTRKAYGVTLMTYIFPYTNNVPHMTMWKAKAVNNCYEKEKEGMIMKV